MLPGLLPAMTGSGAGPVPSPGLPIGQGELCPGCWGGGAASPPPALTGVGPVCRFATNRGPPPPAPALPLPLTGVSPASPPTTSNPVLAPALENPGGHSDTSLRNSHVQDRMNLQVCPLNRGQHFSPHLCHLQKWQHCLFSCSGQIIPVSSSSLDSFSSPPPTHQQSMGSQAGAAWGLAVPPLLPLAAQASTSAA